MPDPVLGSVATNDIVSVNVFATLSGQRVMNTFYYECLAAPTLPVDRWTEWGNLNTAIRSVAGWWTQYLACMTPDVTINFARFQTVNPARQIYRQFNLSDVGTFPDACLTPNLAASVMRRGEFANRRSIGRIQIFGIPTTELSDGLILPGLGVPLNDFASQYNAALTTSSTAVWVPVLTSVNPTTGARVTTTIVSASPQSTVRVMRRRTVRVGE